VELAARDRVAREMADRIDERSALERRGLALQDAMAVRKKSDTRGFRFWSTWLEYACWAMALLGLLLVAFDSRALPGLTKQLSQSFWLSDKIPAGAARYHRFANAVLGSVMVAWGVTLAWVTRHAFKAREPWAWRCVALSVGIWVFLDTGSSALLEVWPNVVLNLLSVIPFVPPLLLTRRYFRAPAE
jgi:hypothetical protein